VRWPCLQDPPIELLKPSIKRRRINRWCKEPIEACLLNFGLLFKISPQYESMWVILLGCCGLADLGVLSCMVGADDPQAKTCSSDEDVVVECEDSLGFLQVPLVTEASCAHVLLPENCSLCLCVGTMSEQDPGPWLRAQAAKRVCILVKGS
jgi:hypothetical protein